MSIRGKEGQQRGDGGKDECGRDDEANVAGLWHCQIGKNERMNARKKSSCGLGRQEWK